MDVVRTKERTETELNTLTQANGPTKIESRPVERPAFEALSGNRHETKDVLKQLHTNIQLLEDLGGRLGFVMSEIRSLIRR